MLTRGDFHIHSTASDGALSPEKIVLTAKSTGIDTIAITDHNTVDGIERAAVAGRLYGVSVIPGVELSTRYKGESIHILGYFKDGRFCSSTFRNILRLIKNHRAEEARRKLNKYMNTESSGEYLSVLEGISFLREFGAAVVLAHPVRISQKNFLGIIRMPFDGIEAKYCLNNYQDTCFFVNLALSHFAFYTGGSDFHSAGRHDKHSFIGQPFLNSKEIKRFLSKSGVLILR
jgi:predicted metal-dependent phosphoesterase TrpH